MPVLESVERVPYEYFRRNIGERSDLASYLYHRQ